MNTGKLNHGHGRSDALCAFVTGSSRSHRLQNALQGAKLLFRVSTVQLLHEAQQSSQGFTRRGRYLNADHTPVRGVVDHEALLALFRANSAIAFPAPKRKIARHQLAAAV